MQRPNGNRPMFESSLELKCLFFFGVALFVVISMSFWMYWSVTEAQILSQNLPMARSLAKQHWIFEHIRKADLSNSGPSVKSDLFPTQPSIVAPNNINTSLKGGDAAMQDDFRKAIMSLIGEETGETRVIRSPSFGIQRSARNMPLNDYEEHLLEQYRQMPELAATSPSSTPLIDPKEVEKLVSDETTKQFEQLMAPSTNSPTAPIPEPPLSPQNTLSGKNAADGSELKKTLEATSQKYFSVRTDQEGLYHYYEPRWAETGCLQCHRIKSPDLKVGDLIGIIEVTIADPPSQGIATQYWVWLLVASIVTAVLAMLAFYVIVRWIIIKPLRHLRHVSDSISHGDISQRAELHTGDEFEALGLAFNRTVRQILNTQEKLQGINTELDSRVDQLARVNVQLYESNRVKSDFMATMSHELRTPLNSIIGFSEVLSSIASLDEKQKRYVENIGKSGKTLLSMINDILDMAKIDSGRIEIQPSAFAIDAVVYAQCDMAKPLVDRKNIDIECDLPEKLPQMYQDASRIQQILNNLLSNAIKFTPEGGRIKVQVRQITASQSATASEAVVGKSDSTTHDAFGNWNQHNQSSTTQLPSHKEPMLQLKVIDTGVGVSEDDQQIIFEKFRQGKSSMAEGDMMKREYSGSGLGLSIVKELCCLLGGAVVVESQLGLGSTFTVVLPWVFEPQTRIESEMMVELQAFSKSAKIKAKN